MRDANDGWLLIQRGYSRDTFKAWEGLFTLGSGGLHVRGSLEEPLANAPQNEEYSRQPANVTSEVMRHPISKWGTYVPGIYGRHPVLGLQLINLPWFLWLVPIVDGERLDMQRCEIRMHERRMNLREAILSRSVTWMTGSGKSVELEYARYIDAIHDRTSVQLLRVDCDSDCDLAIESGIDADVLTNGFDHFQTIDFDQSNGIMRCAVRTDCGGEVAIETKLTIDESKTFHIERRRAWWTIGSRIEAENPLLIEKRSRVRIVRRGGQSQVEDSVAAEWQARWNSCDVEIEGDPQSQCAIRAALFHLLRAHPGEESALAIDAKGYAGEAYWGRFFWDTEIYLLPFYLHTNPSHARSLIEFRVRTLAAAMENAKSRGCAGAKYPWEAGPDGTEECPNSIYPDQEIHITADVVYGIAHYAAATGDESFLLRDDVQHVLVETARYWMNRIDWIDGRPHLLGVMGPDEYSPDSNDNAYTNAMVSLALRFAARCAKPQAAERERAEWDRIASELPILHHPNDHFLILQCENFHQLPTLNFESVWKDRSKTLSAQVSLELLHRSQALKQADVILLMLLLENRVTIDERRRAWEYYVPLTTHDSSLSPATHALFAARLGLQEETWSYWNRACGIDLDVEHGGAAEGIHIASCGMLWQTIVYGFAGVDSAMQTDFLTLHPRIPNQWRALRFPFVWRGNRFDIAIDHEEIVVRNRGPGETACVVVNRIAKQLAIGVEVSWNLVA